MIAVAITLVILGLMIRAFTFAGNEISKARAVIELSDALSTASTTIRNDLRHLTLNVNPPIKVGNDEGYFEILEGDLNDNIGTLVDPTTLQYSHLGDVDDVMMFTVRNLEQPFRGRFNGRIIESKVAEVIYWTQVDDRDGNGLIDVGDIVTLHRRVMLVRPDLNDENGNLVRDNDVNGNLTTGPFTDNAVNNTIYNFVTGALSGFANDVSVRIDSNGRIAANSLADLTKRENRFAHHVIADGDGDTVPDGQTFAFPFAINVNTLSNYRLVADQAHEFDANNSSLIESEGEDVLLSNLLAFDLKVFDPLAPLYLLNGTNRLVAPGDLGYDTAFLGGGTVASNGAYVDIGYGFTVITPITFPLTFTPPAAGFATHFSGVPNVKSQLVQRNYCTWSTHYESDGIDQTTVGTNPITGAAAWQIGETQLADQTDNDSDGVIDNGIDEGRDGIDNDGQFGPDDAGEQETAAPYPHALRGVKIILRVVESSSQQVRQTSVEHSFLP